MQRLWAAFGQLPVSSAPAGGSAGPRAGSKQARVIGLLQRPEGATIDEIASAMGWQRHTVRGLISGALKKKLGLHVLSEATDRGRLYRISESRSAAR
jgi:predicted ArsR family transcriptional regulator